MLAYLVLDHANDPCYIALEHPEGFSAYDLNECGGTMQPVAHGYSIGEIVEQLNQLDSDASVGLSVSYKLVCLAISPQSELYQAVKDAIAKLKTVVPDLESDGFNDDCLVDALEELKEYQQHLDKKERIWMQP